MISCTNCHRPYPETGLPWRCPVCGGLYDFDPFPAFDPAQVDDSQPGIWRHRRTFGLPPDLPPASLGEGRTRLVPARAFGRKLYFKCEYENPTGSFKDRGTAVILGWLTARGVSEVVEDSSGNAGASLAAYAGKFGLRARIFVPQAASGPKRQQIETYGAELVPIPGSRSDVAEAVRREAEAGAIYASHAWLPFNLPGYATAAYEIWEQLGGRLPGAVVVPAGQGGLLLGLARGFESLRAVSLRAAVGRVGGGISIRPSAYSITAAVHLHLPQVQVSRPGGEAISSQAGRLFARGRLRARLARADTAIPEIIGVQARACAPLWALFTAGMEGLRFAAENPTLAEGVKVAAPVRAEAVLRAVAAGSGSMCAVDEDEILPGRAALARLGFEVEPTSAIVWSALRQTLHTLPDPVVVILTGAGWKYGG